MADVKISALPSATTPDGTEKAAIVQSGTTKQVSVGSAIGYNVTTSATDTTAGRVMKVGDFGLGANTFSGGVPIITQGTTDGSADLDKLQTVGFFQGAPTANAPPSGSVFAVRVEKHFEPAWVQQYAFSVTENRLFFRRTNASVWQAWQEFYHSGNYPSDTAWTTVTSLSNGWTGMVQYIKRAGWVFLQIVETGGSPTSLVLLTLPSGYRPTQDINGATTTGARILLSSATGELALSAITAGQFGSIAYPVI